MISTSYMFIIYFIYPIYKPIDYVLKKKKDARYFHFLGKSEFDSDSKLGWLFNIGITNQKKSAWAQNSCPLSQKQNTVNNLRKLNIKT